MSAVEILKQRDAQYRRALKDIGSAIGYGNAQSILGELWDELLRDQYGAAPGRGSMGVTVDDDLPPLPKAANKRRQQRANGGYCLVPAYTEAELKAYARSAVEVEREWCADEADYWIGFDKSASEACDDIAAAIRSHSGKMPANAKLTGEAGKDSK